MFRLSAFGDEISPDPIEQVAILQQCGIRFIELRSILQTHLLDLTDLQVKELKALLDQNSFRVSALASPIGKVQIDQPFGPHWERFRHALTLCKMIESPNLRVFSYYLAEGSAWDDWRRDILDRLFDMGRLAAKAGVRLLHENEHGTYGDDPERVRDVLETVAEQVDEPYFGAVCDPANYVLGGFDPWQSWQLTQQWTAHFHIKDWVHGENQGRLAGKGQGRIAAILADATARHYDGFATLEPHLLSGGPTGGLTGPELFPQAVSACKRILDEVGATYE